MFAQLKQEIHIEQELEEKTRRTEGLTHKESVGSLNEKHSDGDKVIDQHLRESTEQGTDHEKRSMIE